MVGDASNEYVLGAAPDTAATANAYGSGVVRALLAAARTGAAANDVPVADEPAELPPGGDANIFPAAITVLMPAAAGPETTGLAIAETSIDDAVANDVPVANEGPLVYESPNYDSGGAPAPAPSSIVAFAINDSAAPPPTGKAGAKSGPAAHRPRPGSVARSLPTAMSGQEVWDMAIDAGKPLLVNGLMPALQVSKLLKRTKLSNDNLKKIWTASKADIAKVPRNVMSKAEFVKAYELALVAGGQPFQAASQMQPTLGGESRV